MEAKAGSSVVLLVDGRAFWLVVCWVEQLVGVRVALLVVLSASTLVVLLANSKVVLWATKTVEMLAVLRASNWVVRLVD